MKLTKAITCIALFISVISYCQLSPGDLTEAHKEYEGMSNCTLCHDLGEKVTNKKCLDCHKEIKSLLSENRGYHANSTISKKDCFECHGEHFGRKFEMVRLDEINFDHELTGYKLEGNHEVVDCRKCHVPDNIADKNIKKLENTFLGLDQKCLACHDDYHQETLASNECVLCHSMESFVPASKFDHDESEFKLVGKHELLDCAECHEKGQKNGQDFQEFNLAVFNDCKSCHDDPHNNQIPGRCMQCHTEASFAVLSTKGRFDHNSTGFTLRGSHNSIDCFSCHTKTSNPLAVFQDRKATDENSCVTCHDDFHEGKYSNDCAKCHTERSFLSLKSMDFFDHTIPDYTLEGKHLEVDCKKCHQERFSTPIDFSACNKCHEDYHMGDFEKNGFSPDCIQCHSLENGFEYSLYTLEKHQATTFPLKGAHVATPCYACHVDERDDKWRFKNLGSSCVECHQDLHEGFISEKYYPEQECVLCHSNENWSEIQFDHTLTNWPLTGRHMNVNCSDCHFDLSDNNYTLVQYFSSLENKCATCHENIHDDMFAINGETDCVRCHITDSWFPEKFDHNSTAFPLEGRHAEIDCKDCHITSIVDGKSAITYKIGKFECIDCHQ